MAKQDNDNGSSKRAATNSAGSTRDRGLMPPAKPSKIAKRDIIKAIREVRAMRPVRSA